jgi:hypothetical protein
LEAEDNIHTRGQELTDQIEISTQYFFNEWSGSENIIELAQIYLDELTSILKDGNQAGFIIL